MKLRLTEEIWKEGNMFVSYCPELDVASCGESEVQARKNLKEAIIITIEETKKTGTFDRFLHATGFEQVQSDIMSVRKELIGFSPIEVGI